MKKKVFKLAGIAALFLFTFSCHRGPGDERQITSDLRDLHVGGLYGTALDESRTGRLSDFIIDENSPMVKLFSREAADHEYDPNWRGEHVGKWMIAAAQEAYRTDDKELEQHLKTVAAYLISQQRENGYLGTYALPLRITHDSIVNVKSWDIWVHGYLVEGLLTLNRYFPDPQYLEAARKIMDMIYHEFVEKGKSIANVSYHSGMVGTGTIGPAVEMYQATGDKKYLELATYCVDEMEKRPGLGLVTRNLKGYDVAEIGNGKMYEMLRNYVGLAKLYQVSGEMHLLDACLHAWKNIRDYHLNAAGGPRGGVGIHPECFNVGYMFSPYSLSETCASMDWVRFNEELLKITGRAEFADQLEWSLYNAIPGAMFPDGEGWIYHSKVNGTRERTSPLACCSSSGPIALESFTDVMYYTGHGRIDVNLYSSSSDKFSFRGKELKITQVTGYPFSDTISLIIEATENVDVPVWLRIPGWVKGYDVLINGGKKDLKQVREGFIQPGDKWKGTTQITLVFPRTLNLVQKNSEYNEKGWYMDDTTHYLSFTYGPFLLASQTKDEQKEPAGLIIESNDLTSLIQKLTPHDSSSFSLDSLLLTPFYRTGGRVNGSYRKVWFESGAR